MHDSPVKVTEPKGDELSCSLGGTQCWEDKGFSALDKAGTRFGKSVKTQGTVYGEGFCVFGTAVPRFSVCWCHEQCLPAIDRDTGLDIASVKEMFATGFSSLLGTGLWCPCISISITVCRNSYVKACTSPSSLAQHFAIHSSLQRWH